MRTVRIVVCHTSISIGCLTALATISAAQSLAVPGTIQVEDFDAGPAGVAYADRNPGNSGGEYRATDVDIEACTDGGFNVGWVYAGEWLKYTVNVAQAGEYKVEFRLASNSAGGRFHLEVDGVDRTGPITIPDTGGWQSWTTLTKSGVNLRAGSQIWRLVIDAAGKGGNVGNLNYIRASGPTTNTTTSTPYTGTPAALPGILQVEDFDNGGEGVSYSDSSVSNEGAQYRSTAVDIEATTDVGGGYDIGWAFAGEWLAYTVNVASAGTYDVEVRVASKGVGGTFHIEANGIDKTGPMTVPDTNGWQRWVTVRKTGLSLGQGRQVLRLVMDTDGPSGAVGNVNYIRFTAGSAGSAPHSGTPAALPGTVQAEDFDHGGEGVAYHDLSVSNDGGQYRSTAVDIEMATDAGGGYNVGWTFAGEWLAYTVTVGAAGTYDIEARVASDGSGGTFHIEVNGVDRTGPFTVPNTGGWQTWVTVRKTGLSLAAGQQVWRLVMDSNGPSGGVGNFNYLRVVSAAAANQPPTAEITAPANGATFTAPATIVINAAASDADGTVAQVDFYAGAQLLGSDASSPYSFSWSGVGAGTYLLTAVARDNQGASTTSAPVSVTVAGTTVTLAALVFTASPDHYTTLLTSYSVALFRSTDPVTAAPLATRNLGKPTPVDTDISVDISDMVNPLPAGSYYAVVAALGSGGSSSSAPSAPFTK